MKRQKRLTWFTAGYAQIANIFPVLVVAPRYFSKQIGLGGLMQVINAFSTVQSSLSFIITSYTDIATWLAVTERLAGFQRRLLAIQDSTGALQELVTRRRGTGLAVRDVELDLPDGIPLLREVTFKANLGEGILITGPSGSGKSTLLRAIAGIWLYGRGEIDLSDRRVLFLPQRPYLPLGTLGRALAYPYELEKSSSTAQLSRVLEKVGLNWLLDELETNGDWTQRLSLGEQQRLAFARIFLGLPDLVFLDEATSALDENSEAELYQLLRTAQWHPTIVSVGHRSTLRRFHDQVLDLAPFMERFAKPAKAPILARRSA
jgi:putative ATP-binding cassette transporter